MVDDKKAAVGNLRQGLAQKGIEYAPSGGDQIIADLDASKKDLLDAQEDYYDARKVLLDRIIKLPDDQFLSTLKGLGRTPDNAFDPAHPPSQEQIAGLRRAMQVDTDMAQSRVALLVTKVADLRATLNQVSTNVLPPFRDAQRDLESQQSLLDALNLRLKQVMADSRLQESPVRIIARAMPPELPSKPNNALNLVISAIAGFFLIVVASLVELALWLRLSKITINRSGKV